MKKTLSAFVIIGVFVLITTVFNYQNKYDIKNDPKDIENSVKSFNTKASPKLQSIKINEMTQIEDTDTWVASMIISKDTFGYAIFKQGMNNRFNLKSVSTGPNITLTETKTNKGLFGILIGQENNLDIHHIVLKQIGDTTFEPTIKISSKENFIKFIEVPQEISTTVPATLVFYDDNNQIIN